MRPEDLIVARLKDVGAVTALVGQRVYGLNLPQKPTLPAVRVQLIDEPNEHHLRGRNDLTRARVQVDVYVAEASGLYLANTIADAVDDAIDAQIFSMGSPATSVTGCFRRMREVMFEANELRLIRIMQDYYVWSAPTTA